MRNQRSQYLLANHGNVSFQNEATLVACQRAAEQGVLMAQLALAQFYSANKTNPSDVLHTYAWYSIASERMSQAWEDATKTMTVDQVLQAEQMAARWLNKKRKRLFDTTQRRGTWSQAYDGGRTSRKGSRLDVKQMVDQGQCSGSEDFLTTSKLGRKKFFDTV